MRVQARLATAALVLTVGIVGLAGAEAAASPAGAPTAVRHITGAAGIPVSCSAGSAPEPRACRGVSAWCSTTPRPASCW
jgi:hypothetical protein